jgi:hypothetical protein
MSAALEPEPAWAPGLAAMALPPRPLCSALCCLKQQCCPDGKSGERCLQGLQGLHLR